VNASRVPAFTAEASLTRTQRSYAPTLRQTPVSAVLVEAAAAKSCDPCQPFPGGFGVGARNCCTRVLKWNPVTKTVEWTWDCTTEICTVVDRAVATRR
jgi:hypothetical protein